MYNNSYFRLKTTTSILYFLPFKKSISENVIKLGRYVSHNKLIAVYQNKSKRRLKTVIVSFFFKGFDLIYVEKCQTYNILDCYSIALIKSKVPHFPV